MSALNPKSLGEQARRVGAWENQAGNVCFGSWMALDAMVHHIAGDMLADQSRYQLQQLAARHQDDKAADMFAVAMKTKLAAARINGRGGWDDPARCTVEYLAQQLVSHVAKGDPVDVANFAMMLHQRGAARNVLAAAIDTSRMRQMLEAMQAGELTVSRGLELLDMWLAGNYTDDQLPAFTANEALDNDTLPLDVIRGLQMRVADLDGEIKALLDAMHAPRADGSLPYNLSWDDAPEWATALVTGQGDVVLVWADEFKEGAEVIKAQTAYVRRDAMDDKVGDLWEINTLHGHGWRLVSTRPAAPAPQVAVTVGDPVFGLYVTPLREDMTVGELAAKRPFAANIDKLPEGEYQATVSVRRFNRETNVTATVHGNSLAPVSLEPVEGDLLPAIGDTVLINLGSLGAWVPQRVVGYYVLGDLNSGKALHRVFVRVVDDKGHLNARMLCDVRRFGEEGGAK